MAVTAVLINIANLSFGFVQCIGMLDFPQCCNSTCDLNERHCAATYKAYVGWSTASREFEKPVDIGIT